MCDFPTANDRCTDIDYFLCPVDTTTATSTIVTTVVGTRSPTVTTATMLSEMDCGPAGACGIHQVCVGACPPPGPCASVECVCASGFVDSGIGTSGGRDCVLLDTSTTPGGTATTISTTSHPTKAERPSDQTTAAVAAAAVVFTLVLAFVMLRRRRAKQVQQTLEALQSQPDRRTSLSRPGKLITRQAVSATGPIVLNVGFAIREPDVVDEHPGRPVVTGTAHPRKDTVPGRRSRNEYNCLSTAGSAAGGATGKRTVDDSRAIDVAPGRNAYSTLDRTATIVAADSFDAAGRCAGTKYTPGRTITEAVNAGRATSQLLSASAVDVSEITSEVGDDSV